MMRRLITLSAFSIALAVCLLSGNPRAETLPTLLPTSDCDAAKSQAAGRETKSLLACHAKVAAKGATVDADCMTKARNAFANAFQRAEAKGNCTTTGIAQTVEGDVAAFVDDSVSALRPGASASKGTALKLSAVGKYAAALLARNVKSFGPAQRKLGAAFKKAESKGSQTTGDAPMLNASGIRFAKAVTHYHGIDLCRSCRTVLERLDIARED